MLMIVNTHIISHGGLLNYQDQTKEQYYLIWFLFSINACAVNCYVLTSGYVIRKYKLCRLLELWSAVFFYSLIFFFMKLFLFQGVSSISAKQVIMEFFPLMTNKYWFFTAYVGMYFFIPVLNMFIENTSKEIYQRLLLVLLIFFSIMPTLLRGDTFLITEGFSTWWFLILFLLGGYFRKNTLRIKLNRLVCIVIFLLGVSLAFGWKVFSEDFLGIEKGNQLLIYTSPLVVLAGLMLFLLAKEIKLNGKFKKIISFFASACFGVYLIHENIYIREELINEKLTFALNYGIFTEILIIIAISILIFLFCIAIEHMRLILWEKLGINRLCVKIDTCIGTTTIRRNGDKNDIKSQDQNII